MYDTFNVKCDLPDLATINNIQLNAKVSEQ